MGTAVVAPLPAGVLPSTPKTSVTEGSLSFQLMTRRWPQTYYCSWLDVVNVDAEVAGASIICCSRCLLGTDHIFFSTPVLGFPVARWGLSGHEGIG